MMPQLAKLPVFCTRGGGGCLCRPLKKMSEEQGHLDAIGATLTGGQAVVLQSKTVKESCSRVTPHAFEQTTDLCAHVTRGKKHAERSVVQASHPVSKAHPKRKTKRGPFLFGHMPMWAKRTDSLGLPTQGWCPSVCRIPVPESLN